MKHRSLFTDIPPELPQEFFEDILKTDSFRVERIVSKGHITPENEWYDQKDNEWVLVVEGEATLLFEEGMKTVPLKAGDHINIPAHARHRVSWTKPDTETVWLAIFY
ncbi:cupin domain-containing protein [Vibrio sp. Of7-15]|uniref:cupin domain-containing protein n=1 Tax=Vibrio sp. Of7-15 TaxID=2724879 RepID=UPI001EF18652|nr:cupin domain-containing protein [Vibrio sp. Of7-15]MCG7500176.1 cupin domain-containing protein [Vibrio sp. Of7-15]